MENKLSINDFVSHFGSGVARSNLFKVSFQNIDFEVQGSVEHLFMACKAVQIPGITFVEGKYMHNGFYRKSAIAADLDPITMTFIVDGMGKTLEIFEEWSNKILDRSSPTGNPGGGSAAGTSGTFGFKDDYDTDIHILVFDRSGQIVDYVEVFNAYPTNIEAIELSYDSADTAMEISVSFNFDRMLSVFKGKSPDAGALKSILNVFNFDSKAPFTIPKLPALPVMPSLPISIPAINRFAIGVGLPKLPLSIPRIQDLPGLDDYNNKSSATNDMITRAQSLKDIF
jgi:hypothetical protein